jgi:hypothetical protein
MNHYTSTWKRERERIIRKKKERKETNVLLAIIFAPGLEKVLQGDAPLHNHGRNQ